jgi:hypothetical protein
MHFKAIFIAAFALATTVLATSCNNDNDCPISDGGKSIIFHIEVQYGSEGMPLVQGKCAKYLLAAGGICNY